MTLTPFTILLVLALLLALLSLLPVTGARIELLAVSVILVIASLFIR